MGTHSGRSSLNLPSTQPAEALRRSVYMEATFNMKHAYLPSGLDI